MIEGRVIFFMINKIECLFYQLYDVSKYINKVSKPKFISKNYDLYSCFLTIACIEEKFILKRLELVLNDYFDLKESRSRFFKSNNSVIIDNHHKSWIGSYNDNWHYYFHFPKSSFRNKSSKEFIELVNLFESFKKDTNDIDYFTTSMEDKYIRLFRLQVRHHDFNSDEWLKDKGVSIEFI